MATLQKFKLLATQCGVTQSPTRSPRTSPVVNFRRPKTTLRMLLTRTSSRKSSTCREISYPQSFVGNLTEKKKGDKGLSGRTLKDLFVSSALLEEEKKMMAKLLRRTLAGRVKFWGRNIKVLMDWEVNRVRLGRVGSDSGVGCC